MEQIQAQVKKHREAEEDLAYRREPKEISTKAAPGLHWKTSSFSGKELQTRRGTTYIYTTEGKKSLDLKRHLPNSLVGHPPTNQQTYGPKSR
ncbi:hypothetical protein CR513_48171, partial [Mucuna pruriens]